MFGISIKKRVSRSVPTIETSREKLWDSLFAVVECARRLVILENPSGCLRREETRPRTLESSYFSAVATVVHSPRRARRSSGEVPSLAGGRLLVYFPEEDLADGAAESESGGFFDVHNAPPWDTWVAMVEDDEGDRARPYLVSWVPPEFLMLAEAGIHVNPEECIRWLDDTDVAMRAVCAELRAG